MKRFLNFSALSIWFAGALLAIGCNPQKMDYRNLPLTDLEGNVVSLADYKGKPIVLNFWATWCGDCLVEKPSFDRARQALSADSIAFIAISDEPIEKIARYKAKKNYEFQYLHLAKNIKTLGIFAIPYTLIIDKNGKVVFSHQGSLKWDAPENIALLQTLVR